MVENTEITSQVITFEDLPFCFREKEDPYKIAAMCSVRIQSVFKENPNLNDKQKPFVYFKKVNGLYGGIAMFFPTLLKAGLETIHSFGGSTLEVAEEYRHYALGADIITFPIENRLSDVLIYAGISPMALPLYKKMRFAVLEYPRAMQLRNSRCIYETKGVSGSLLFVLSGITNFFLRIYYCFTRIILYSAKKKYKVVEEKIIPDWAETMVMADTHKYAEVHDQGWMQWNLDQNFSNSSTDHQHFYSIMHKNNPVGFFMTKERFKKEAGGILHNVTVGSIMEWAVSPDNIIDEKIINLLAMDTFTTEVDIVEFATADKKVIKAMKFLGFIPHGFAHIVIKDLSKRYSDMQDINNWRVRYAYSDVFLT